MKDQRFKKGQIVWYTGPDLVAYETGKTYTVLGYNKKLDMYGILSYLDDEVFMLPEDVLKPLSEEEEKTIRISDRMYEYYHDVPDIRVDLGEIEEERMLQINETARDDVRNSRLKREAEEFLSKTEYELYLLELLEKSSDLRNGIEPSAQWFSETCLYIDEFHPENVIKTDKSEEYDWEAEERIYNGSWPAFDGELKRYLGRTTYEGHGAYPASCCWLFDKSSLLELVNAFPEIFHSFDSSVVDKEKYVMIRCHWD